MSNEGTDVDLPVAITVEKQGALVSYRYSGLVDLKDGSELVKRRDAEAAIAKERSRKYDEGFFEGRQSREEEILDKIKDKREKFNNGRSNEYPQTVLTELLQKIRRSRQHES